MLNRQTKTVLQVENFRDATDVLGLKVAPLQVPMARRLQVTDNIDICLQEFFSGNFFSQLVCLMVLFDIQFRHLLFSSGWDTSSAVVSSQCTHLKIIVLFCNTMHSRYYQCKQLLCLPLPTLPPQHDIRLHYIFSSLGTHTLHQFYRYTIYYLFRYLFLI